MFYSSLLFPVFSVIFSVTLLVFEFRQHPFTIYVHRSNQMLTLNVPKEGWLTTLFRLLLKIFSFSICNHADEIKPV